MRTGKLAISRGYQLPASVEEPAAQHLALVPQPDAPAEAEPVLPLSMPVAHDYDRVHDRLTALERLTRLLEQGALSADEFVEEKALILGRRADEQASPDAAPASFDPARPRRSQRGPSLAGRMLSWKVLLVGLVIGLGFSFATQPDATLQMFDQVTRYLRA